MFVRTQPLDWAQLYKKKPNRIQKKTEDTDLVTEKERLEKYLLNELRKDSNAKISFDFFENEATFVSLDNTNADNFDTEVNERDFFGNLRQNNGSFNPRYSKILNTLSLPQCCMINSLA